MSPRQEEIHKMQWRVAKSLLQLKKQVDQAFPDRSKDSDGSIGDGNHQSRSSDHTPWVDGNVVTAIDITHDPENGCDSYRMAEELKASRDRRIKYIISDRKICSSEVSPWNWRPYRGANPHDHHVHISVHPNRDFYDDTSPWKLPMLDGHLVTAMDEVGDPPVPFWKRWWKHAAGYGTGGGIGLGTLIYDWRVAIVLIVIGAIIFLIVWFTFLRDYLKRQ
jgi:hypothetical protein